MGGDSDASSGVGASVEEESVTSGRPPSTSNNMQETRNDHNQAQGDPMEVQKKEKYGDSAKSLQAMREKEAWGYALMQIAGAPFVAILVLAFPLIVANAERQYVPTYTTKFVSNGTENITHKQKPEGLRPGTILSALTSMGSILAALSLPVVGAVVDGTRFRKRVLFVAFGLVLVECLIITILLPFPKQWLLVSVLTNILRPAVDARYVAQNGYLSEYGGAGSDGCSRTNTLSGYATAAGYSTVMIAVIIYNAVLLFSDDEDDMSLLASGFCLFATICMALCAYFSYVRLEARPHPMNPIKKGEHILTIGFVRLGRTLITVWSEYPDIARYLFSLLFFEAAVSSNGALSIIYATEVLHLSLVQVTTGFSIAAILSVVGAIICGWLSFKVPPKRLTETALFIFILTTIANGAFVRGFGAALLVFAIGGLIVGLVRAII